MVVGAGAVGSAIARNLVAASAEVRVVTRRGVGVEGAEAVMCDASEPSALRMATAGASVIYNAANPSQYHKWASIWPPLSASILAAAEASDAVLATVSNLYPYGKVPQAMTEDLPLRPVARNGEIRRDMWLAALASHEAGRIRAVEVRGADYVGAGAQSFFARGIQPLLEGKSPRGLGDVSLPKTWTYPGDLARTLIAAANDDAACGRAWHAVSNPPLSQQELMDALADSAGVERRRVKRMPKMLLQALRPFVPILAPVLALHYQYEAPFIMDDSAARKAFGITPTPWAPILAEVVADARIRDRA